MAKTESNLLNDVALRQFVRAGAPVAKADGAGLTFTLSTAGTATWVLRYRHGGRRHELTLGRYPDISLKDARKLASANRVAVQTGVNPATERRAIKSRKDWSVRQLIQDYEEKILPGLAASTRQSYGRNLKRVASGMGALSISDVTAADVVAQIERVQVGYVERFTLWIVLKAIFKHATGKRMLTQNPCAGINLESIIGQRPAIRKRIMLTEHEIRTVLNADMHPANRLAVSILLATGARVSELFTAKWADVSLDSACWRIPASKTGSAMDVPLAPIVVEWFRHLKAQADSSLIGSSGFVLPARKQTRFKRAAGDAHISKDVIWNAIDYWIEHHKPEVRRFTPHDLRSTMKSHLRKLGVARDISEMCLNHKLAGVEGVYDQYTYWEERKTALERWADFLIACRDADDNVIFGKFGTAK